MSEKPSVIKELEQEYGISIERVQEDDLIRYRNTSFTYTAKNNFITGLGFVDAIIDIKTFPIIPTLTHLFLVDCRAYNCSFLEKFLKLTHLNLTGNQIQDCAPLASLTSLTELNLTDNKIQDCAPLASLTLLTELDLSSNKIQDCAPLSSLTSLTHLDLSFNMVKDCTPLASLTSLTNLDLTDNKIKDCAPLASLTLLAKLNLTGNKIQVCDPLILMPSLTTLSLAQNDIRDCGPLTYLTSLTELHLSGNLIRDCAPLAPLTLLTVLSLGGNLIQNCGPLAFLTSLKELYLSGNHIHNCAPLASLTSLTVLRLSENKIQDLSPLAPLTSLTALDLGHNQIQDCTPLTSLTSLTILYLSNNKIQDCAPLSFLSSLTGLYLSGNQIQDCGPLAILNDLDHLDLRNNHIKNCRDLQTLSKRCHWKWAEGWFGSGINLFGNPLSHPPVEIAARGHEAINAWFDAQETGHQPLREAKVLLVGAGAAGKTSLVRALLDKGFDSNQFTTHGIEVVTWSPVSDGAPLHVHLWDFGGQEIMHATHQFFLSERSLYVLVLDGRKEDGLEEYWLKMIESFGGDSPIMVVLTKADQSRGYDVNRRILQKKYPGIQGFWRVSSATGEGVSVLCEAMTDQLAALDLVNTPWPKTWFQVKTALETMDAPYINYAQYDATCFEEGVVAEDQRRTLLHFLHDLGIALHFPDLEWLDTQVLKPNWVTEPIYALINHPELAERFGELHLNDCRRLLPDFPSDRLPYLKELMTHFEISHPVGKTGLLLPDLLPVGEPDLPFTPGDSDLFLTVHYHFLPRALMPRLMVRRYTEIHTAGTTRYQWRSGALFRHPQLDALLLVRVDDDSRRLELRAQGRRAQTYLGLFRKTLHDLHQSFKHIGAVEQIRCICPECLHQADAETYDPEVLTKLKKKGNPSKQCDRSGTMVPIDELLAHSFGPRIETQNALVALFTGLAQTVKTFTAFQGLADKVSESLELPSDLDTSKAITQAWAARTSKRTALKKTKAGTRTRKKPKSSELGWLHLSDIHYTAEKGWDSDRVLRLLGEDAAKLAETQGLTPRFLCVTGDLGNGEGTSHIPLKDQICQTLKTIKNIATKLGIAQDDIFVVAGNHDVNRKAVSRMNRALLNGLNPHSTDDQAYVDNLLASQDQPEGRRDTDWPPLHKRLDAYYTAVAAELPHLYSDPHGQGVYGHTREIDGKRVGLFGFNGAWSCGPDEARGNLWLGSTWQLNKAETLLDGCDLRIGLIHHPPDWYTEVERDTLKRLHTTFHLLLHGHEHDAWLHPGHGHLRIAAGASYAAGTAEYGYNLACIDPTTGKGRVYLRTYNGRAWLVHPTEHALDGTWPFSLKNC